MRRGGAALVVLVFFVWVILFQNLPDYCTEMMCTKVPTSAGIDRTLKLFMLAFSIGVIATRWALAVQLLKSVNPGLLMLMALVPTSAIWSIDREATLLRYFTLTCIVLTCFAIPLVSWNRSLLRQVAVPPIMYVLLASLVLGALYPDKIVEVGEDISQLGAWHGITYKKNQFGMFASQAVILCFHRWIAADGKSVWSILGVIVGTTCLILSRNDTSLFATFLGVGFIVLVMRIPLIRKRYTTHTVILVAATLVVYQLAIQDLIPGVGKLLSPILSLTGKDATLSARTIIWEIVKEVIRAYPFLGVGYGAYWIDDPGSPSYMFMYLLYFYPTNSHNGYLEVRLDLGYPGLVCLAIFLYWYIRQSLKVMKFDRAQAVMYLAILYHQMVMNMSESEWFSRSSTFAVLLLCSTCMNRALFEQRRKIAQFA